LLRKKTVVFIPGKRCGRRYSKYIFKYIFSEGTLEESIQMVGKTLVPPPPLNLSRLASLPPEVLSGEAYVGS
jgi:hypothetical protein